MTSMLSLARLGRQCKPLKQMALIKKHITVEKGEQ